MNTSISMASALPSWSVPTSGDDSLYAGKGSGLIDGGAGRDSVSIGGSFVNFRIDQDPATGDLTLVSPQQELHLHQVEELRFGDLTLNLAEVSIESGVIRFLSGNAEISVQGYYGNFDIDVDVASGRLTMRGFNGTGEAVVLEGVRSLNFLDGVIPAAQADSGSVQRSVLPDGSVHFSGNDLGVEGWGRDGDDVLAGNGGDDSLYGGKGQDTAVYRGSRSDYDVEYDPLTTTYRVIDHVAGRDGADTLRGVEQLRFADGTWATEEVVTKVLPMPVVDPILLGFEEGSLAFTEDDLLLAYASTLTMAQLEFQGEFAGAVDEFGAGLVGMGSTHLAGEFVLDLP